MKKNLKIIVDMIMLMFVIVLMCYLTVETQIHEVLGTITIILFIIHLFLNKQWLKTLRKGHYHFQRVVYLIINFLLMIVLFFVVISSLMISSYVFSFLPFQTSQLARNMHLASTAWLFILISLHIGLHLNVLMSQMKKSSLKYICYVILIVWYIYGFVTFKNAGLYNDMFIINEFKFFDYNMNSLHYYFNYLSIVYFISMSLHCIMMLKQRK